MNIRNPHATQHNRIWTSHFGLCVLQKTKTLSQPPYLPNEPYAYNSLRYSSISGACPF